jgi:hypothetical protein
MQDLPFSLFESPIIKGMRHLTILSAVMANHRNSSSAELRDLLGGRLMARQSLPRPRRGKS